MGKFVIHKKVYDYKYGFDVIEDVNGSIVAVFDNLEEAELEKDQQEILSMQEVVRYLNNNGMSSGEIFFDDDEGRIDKIYNENKDYFLTEFGIELSEDYPFEFPNEINEVQAKFFLKTFEISFNHIVEYDDDFIINPDDFLLDEDDYEIMEF